MIESAGRIASRKIEDVDLAAVLSSGLSPRGIGFPRGRATQQARAPDKKAKYHSKLQAANQTDQDNKTKARGHPTIA